MADTTMNFRVDEGLKKGFELVAEKNDLTSSQLLRRLMRDAVAQHMATNAQGSLLEQPEAKPRAKAAKKAKTASYGTAKGVMGALLKRGE